MLQIGTEPSKAAGIPRMHCADVPFWLLPGVGVAPAPVFVTVPAALLVAVPLADPPLPSVPLGVTLAMLDVPVALALVLFVSWRRLTLTQRLMSAMLVGWAPFVPELVAFVAFAPENNAFTTSRSLQATST